MHEWDVIIDKLAVLYHMRMPLINIIVIIRFVNSEDVFIGVTTVGANNYNNPRYDGHWSVSCFIFLPA